MGNANRIRRDERVLWTEEIREGYWIWWALKDEVDRKRGGWGHLPEVFAHGWYQGQGLRDSHFWRTSGKRSEGWI